MTRFKTCIRMLIASCIVAFISCNNTGQDKKPSSTGSIKIENQGVNINYNDSQKGDTVLLFVHGWGINQSYWDNQLAHFRGKYRVVTIDLPGFGKSGRNRNSWMVGDYASDISSVLSALDLHHVILVGHSMSGAIVLEAALTNPDRVMGLVGVDNFQDVGFVLTPQIEKEWAVFYDSARVDFRKAVSVDMAPYLFSASTPDSIKNRVLKDILSTDPDFAMDCLQNADKFPMRDKLSILEKKLVLINSNVRPTDTADLHKTGVSFQLLEIGPTGHYPMIEKPADFNRLLQQAIYRLKNH